MTLARAIPKARYPGWRFVRVALMLCLAWGVLLALDYMLARNARDVLAQAEQRHQAALSADKAMEPWVWRLERQDADVCNALTGGIWLSWLMPFTRALELPEGMEVAVEGGRCRRHAKHTLVFRGRP